MFKKLVQMGIQKITGSKVSPTITKVDPFVPKNKSETLARDLARAKQKRKTSEVKLDNTCLLYTSPSPRDGLLSRMPSSA